MGRRRISQNEVEEIGRNRILRLTDMAREETRKGNVDRARRYVEIARRVSAKSKSPMPKESPYCRSCLTPLVPGVNCRVRLSNHMVHTTCCLCGEIARRPYIREQSNEREGRQEGADEESQRARPHRQDWKGRDWSGHFRRDRCPTEEKPPD